MSNWNPSAEPFRVITFISDPRRQGPQPGRPQMFATLEEAMAVADRPMGQGQHYRTVDQAMNPTTWKQNGFFKEVFRRNRKGA